MSKVQDKLSVQQQMRLLHTQKGHKAKKTKLIQGDAGGLRKSDGRERQVFLGSSYEL